eukprot:scaffold207809_cov32-Tisochrysis_lutea.AAC.5
MSLAVGWLNLMATALRRLARPYLQPNDDALIVGESLLSHLYHSRDLHGHAHRTKEALMAAPVVREDAA